VSSTMRALAGRSVRYVFALMVALTGGAFAQSPTRGHAPVPPNGYGDGWFISEFWSREYPPGFSVTRPDAVVAARATMDKAAPRDIACRLPYLAVIHPWNKSRIAKSKVKFYSATKILRLVVKEPFDFDFMSRDFISGTVGLKAGDTIDYIRNDSEGSFEVRIFGKQYTVDQNLFDHVEKVARDQFVEDDWAVLTCVGGNRAYILLSDLGLDPDTGAPVEGERVAGISEVGPGQTDYGRARDLTGAEARELERARRQ